MKIIPRTSVASLTQITPLPAASVVGGGREGRKEGESSFICWGLNPAAGLRPNDDGDGGVDEDKLVDSAPSYFATGEPLRTSDGIPETRGDDRHDPPSAASTRTTDSLLQHDCQESNGHCKSLFPPNHAPNSRKPSAEAKGESFSRLLGGRARSILARLKEPALFQMNFNVDGRI